MGTPIKEYKIYPALYAEIIRLTEDYRLKKNRPLETLEYINESDVDQCFTWANTPQGHNFWQYIQNDNLELAKNTEWGYLITNDPNYAKNKAVERIKATKIIL